MVSMHHGPADHISVSQKLLLEVCVGAMFSGASGHYISKRFASSTIAQQEATLSELGEVTDLIGEDPSMMRRLQLPLLTSPGFLSASVPGAAESRHLGLQPWVRGVGLVWVTGCGEL